MPVKFIKKNPGSKQPFKDIGTPLEAAIKYSEFGYSPVPINPGTKIPKVKWKDYTFKPGIDDQDFADGSGVGVRLGQNHGGLTDLDLDYRTARYLAPFFLPATNCIFGRKSAPGSHYEYVTSGPAKTIKFEATIEGQTVVVLELRGDNQLTVFPPSQHETGEIRVFEPQKAGLPSEVSFTELRISASHLAAASVMAIIWKKSTGSRQDMSMALAGSLLRGKFSVKRVEHFVKSVAECAGDEEVDKRVATVKETHKKFQANGLVWGWPKLAELIGSDGDHVVGKLKKWLDVVDSTSSPISYGDGKLVSIKASDVKSEPVDWLWEGYIPFGAFCIIDGDPSMGKSTITLDIAARLSAGKPLPDGSSCDPATALVITSEDSYATTIVPRLTAAGADMDRIELVNSIDDHTGVSRPFTIPEDIEKLRELIATSNCRLVIIDPIVAFFNPKTNTHNDQQVRQALGPLTKMAEETGVAILAIRHLTKDTKASAMYQGGGSIGMIGAARTALMVGYDPNGDNQRILAVTKNNLGLKPKSWCYSIESVSVVLDTGDTWEAPRINWIETCNIPADALVPTSGKPKSGKIFEAMEFLKVVLKDGPVASKKMKEMSEEAGISYSTLLKAKDKLGIKPENNHDGLTITGWQWPQLE